MKRYFIAYQFNTKDKKSGFGNTTITTSYDHKHIDFLTRVKDAVEDANESLDMNVVILNFIPMGKA